MKKTAKVILRAFFAIALITSVGFLSGRAIAASNPLTVTDASVTAKSDGVTAEISKVENNEITNSVTFNKVNDSVTFKLSIKNTGDKKLTIKSVVDDNSNEFIGYSYEDYAGTELDAGASFNFILKATYKKAVADISARNQSFNVSFSFAYETETGETGEQAVVVTPETPKTAETSNTPNTLDNILHYLGIFALAAAGLVLSIFLIKSANKKIKTAGLAIALVMAAALAMPIIANANDDLAPIKFVNEYALMDRIVVTYNDGTADHTVEISNGDTIDLDDPEVPGYNFGGWEDEDGNEFDPTQPITGDITIHPVLDPIHYTIAIDADGDGDADLTIPATYGESVELPNNEADKPGHTPNGWTDGTNHYGDGEEVSDLTTTDGDTVNLSPDFTPNHFVAEIDTDGDGQVDHTIDVTYGEPANLPTNEAEMPGHTPDGWKDSDGNHYDNNADISDLLVDNDGTISFEPDFTPNHYNIEIDTDGDGDVDVTIPATYGEPVELPTNTATGETGTIPDGWKDGDGNHYDSGEEVINLTDENNGTVSLEPNFSPIHYTVVFNKEGGESITATLAYGDSYTVPSDGGQKEGYRFSSWTGSNGWSYAKGGTISKLTAIDGATITFTPNWQENYYEIYFPRTKNATGATISSINYISYTQDVTLPQNTYVTNNYYADGYNTANDGTGTHYNEGQVVSRLVSEYNGQIALYTDWRPMNYKLVFDKNSDEATGTMAAQSCTYGVTCTLPENSFTYVGHNFKNWQYAANTLSVPGNNVFVNNLTENGQEVSVKAIWGINYYRVYIHKENGSAYKNFSPAYDEDISESLATYATELAQTGYTIDHWNTKADGSGDTYLPGQAVSKLAGQTHASGDTVDLYPTFRKISYHVAIDTDGDGDADINEDLEYGQGYTLPSTAQAEDGYTPNGWTDGTNQYGLGETINNLTTEDGSTITLTPVFELKHYTLKVDTDGDWSYDDRETAVVYGQTSIVLELDTATISNNNPGRTLTGWTDGTNHYAEDADFGSLNVDNNATVYLRPDYRPNEYDVWLDSDNDGTYEKTYHVVYGGEHVYLDTNTYSEVGYLPAGWISDTHVVYGDGIDMSSLPKEDGVVIKLSPYLVSIDYYVEFDYDGDGVVDETDTYSYTREVVLATNTASKPGYTPNGWTDGTHHFDNNTHVNKLTSVNHATVRISPDWTPITYYLYIDINDNYDYDLEVELEYGEEYELPTIARDKWREGFMHDGWLDRGSDWGDDSDDNRYSAGQKIKNLTTVQDGAIGLEPTWSPRHFTAVYEDVYDEDFLDAAPKEFSYEDLEAASWMYPLPGTPVREGYNFIGWEFNGNGTYAVNYIVAILPEDSDDFVIKAIWEKKELEICYFGGAAPDETQGASVCDTIEYGADEYTIRHNYYTRTGYNPVDGWSSYGFDGEQNYTGGQAYNVDAYLDSCSGSCTINLSALWTPKQTVVHFTPGEGVTDATGEIADLVAYYDQPVSYSTGTYTRPGYTHSGWFCTFGGTAGTYGLAYFNTNKWKHLDSEVTCSARWTNNWYRIEFEENAADATGGMNGMVVTYGDTTPLTSNAFEREGYNFIGWKWNNEGDLIADGASAGQFPVAANEETVTLYAQWTPQQPTISYNANGGEGSMEAQSGVSGSKQRLKTPDYTREGYGFVGWNTKADGSGTYYGTNEGLNMPSGGLKLYAIWVAPEEGVTMQTFNKENYSSRSTNSVIALRDARDNNVYAVSKLADGQWWTIENLRLNFSNTAVNITAENTNNPTQEFMTTVNSHPGQTMGSDWCGGTAMECLNTVEFRDVQLHYYDGLFYNGYTATAGHAKILGKNEYITDGDQAGDICPKGWSMPSSSDYLHYNELMGGAPNEASTSGIEKSNRFRKFPFNLVLAGNIVNNGTGNHINSGQLGIIWSKTADNGLSLFSMQVNSLGNTEYNSPNNLMNTNGGINIRCIAQ